MIEIVWDGEPHPELEEAVRKDLDDLMSQGLGSADDLITHLVMLGDPDNDPMVHVHGEGGRFHAAYIAKPAWVTFSESGIE